MADWKTVAEFKVEKIEEYYSIIDFRSKADELPAGTPVRISMDFSPVPVIFDIAGAEQIAGIFIDAGMVICDVNSPGGLLSHIGVIEGFMAKDGLTCDNYIMAQDIQPSFAWAIAGVVAAVIAGLAALGITWLILCKIEAILPGVMLYGTVMLAIAGATILGALYYRYKAGVSYGT